MKLAVLIAALSLVASSAYAHNCGHGGMAGHVASVAAANNASVGHVTAAIAASQSHAAADNASVGHVAAAIAASEHASTVAADNASVGHVTAAINASEHSAAAHSAPASHASHAAPVASPVQAIANALGGLFRRD